MAILDSHEMKIFSLSVELIDFCDGSTNDYRNCVYNAQFCYQNCRIEKLECLCTLSQVVAYFSILMRFEDQLFLVVLNKESIISPQMNTRVIKLPQNLCNNSL